MDREPLLATLSQQSDDTLKALVTLLPAVSEMRTGGFTSVEAFGTFHRLGLPVSLLIQSRPARRERERVEASVISGQTVQLALDFDSLKSA